MKKIICILLCAVSLIISLCACSNHTVYEETISMSANVSEEIKNTDKLDFDLPADFEPFECNGDYYYFDDNEVQNQDGLVFKEIQLRNDPHGRSDKLVYCFNGEEKILIQTEMPDVYFDIWAYIDDALYFSVLGKLYRMTFEYSEDGDIAANKTHLVFNDYGEPVKSENNTLILRCGNNYSLLDTQTGKADSIEYNLVITDKYDNLKGLISMDKAIDIAFNEIKNLKYYDDITTDMTYERVSGFILDDNYPPALIYRPDYVYELTNKWKYESYPEYVWHIILKGEFRITVDVNAQSGSVTNVNVDFLD